MNNKQLEENLVKAVLDERKSLVKVLEHLIEFDNRRVFLELGYSSLFDYCKRKLKYSDGAAHRRICAARLIKNNNKIKEELLLGNVSLCTLALASSEIKTGGLKLEEISNKSKREVELMVALNNPVALPKEEIKPFAVYPEPSRGVKVIAEKSEQNQLSPVTVEERFEIKFSLDKETYLKFKQAQDILSVSSVEDAVTTLVNKFLNPKTRKSEGSKNTSRYISREIKREVYLRDGGECTFVSEDGIKCGCKHFLEYDHVIPFSAGGGKDAGNVRLLCSNHNKLVAKTHPLLSAL